MHYWRMDTTYVRKPWQMWQSLKTCILNTLTQICAYMKKPVKLILLGQQFTIDQVYFGYTTHLSFIKFSPFIYSDATCGISRMTYPCHGMRLLVWHIKGTEIQLSPKTDSVSAHKLIILVINDDSSNFFLWSPAASVTSVNVSWKDAWGRFSG